VTVSATAISRYEKELIVQVEVRARSGIRQVAAPVPVVQRVRDASEDDLRARRAEMYRHFGDRARPITLEDERGVSREEQRRLFTPAPQETGDGLFVTRFVVMFEDVKGDAKGAAMVIPFVELSDLSASTAVDLRTLPADVALGEHRLKVLAAEPLAPDQQKVVIELPRSATGPSLAQPARMQGADVDFAWQRHDTDPPRENTIWMATKVGDPPIVELTGVVLRIEGPLRLELPLTLALS
jgi:hypothetical protein